jgi:hypothetical protein
MRRLVLAALSACTIAGMVAATAPPVGASASTPLWVKHVLKYPGGISNGVRAYLDKGVRTAPNGEIRGTPSNKGDYPNVQMNTDTDPPMPQNETAVAYSLDDPLVAVAASNDYVSGGVAIMRTSNGGVDWRTTRLTPQFRGTGDFCTGGDPAVAYSLRDHVFFLSQLCFFRAQPYSEVHVYVSKDNGRTWTPGRQAARAASNFNYSKGTVDTHIFNDKEYIAVDNNPHSAHYGRLYVTYTKFHILNNGSSDYCPIQLSYTDSVRQDDPSLTVFQHSHVQPNDPGANGKGLSANQFSVPVVEPSGILDIAFAQEECNSSLDHALLFQQSTNGGRTFLPSAIQVDKPGQWEDNPNPADQLPNKKFRTPNTIALAQSPTTGTLAFIYTNYIDMQKSGADIDVSLSTDHGATWSDSIPVSVTKGGANAPNDQFFPWIAAAPDNGDFYAIWLDCRNDPNNHNIETFQAISKDDGGAWPNADISTADWDPDNGFFTSASFIGDYSGLTVSSAAAYPVWTDGRHSAIDRTGIGETDIFTTVELR